MNKLLLLIRIAILLLPAALPKPFAMAFSTAVNQAKRNINITNNTTLHIHWFRHGDLRLHDNPALLHTINSLDKPHHLFLPVFFFDPRFVGNNNPTAFGTSKCGPRRAKFLIESVANLRENMLKLGSGLVVSLGKPEDFFESLRCRDDMAIQVTCQEEVSSEEIQVVKSVDEILQKRGLHSSVTQIWGSTLYNRQQLPFDGGAKGMPDSFTPFRNKVEKHCAIDKPFPPPSKAQLRSTVTDIESFTDCKNCSLTYLPTMEDLGYSADMIEQDDRGVMAFSGGESAALARVQEYIWDKDLLKVYFDTRNGMLGPDYSTKVSPWLAHGCLSPRYIAEQCHKYETQRIANKSTYWVVFELLWRDFFKFLALKHGNSIFYLHGTVGASAALRSRSDKTDANRSSRQASWSTDPILFCAWADGRTGYPLVDANMRELKATGFMSNRGRQNVCSFLAIDMNFDWRYGAYYFEQELIDYDIYSNWGNWVSGAGMLGGRLNRFNIVKQSKDYDFDGDYVRHWLPELRNVPSSLIHEPWRMTVEEQEKYGVKIGTHYPRPIIRPSNYRSYPKGDEPRQIHGNSQGASKGGKKEMKSLSQGKYRFS